MYVRVTYMHSIKQQKERKKRNWNVEQTHSCHHSFVPKSQTSLETKNSRLLKNSFSLLALSAYLSVFIIFQADQKSQSQQRTSSSEQQRRGNN